MLGINLNLRLDANQCSWQLFQSLFRFGLECDDREDPDEAVDSYPRCRCGQGEFFLSNGRIGEIRLFLHLKREKYGKNINNYSGK